MWRAAPEATVPPHDKLVSHAHEDEGGGELRTLLLLS